MVRTTFNSHCDQYPVSGDHHFVISNMRPLNDIVKHLFMKIVIHHPTFHGVPRFSARNDVAHDARCAFPTPHRGAFRTARAQLAAQ